MNDVRPRDIFDDAPAAQVEGRSFETRPETPSFPKGWHVFPLAPNKKTPLPGFTNWEAAASNDPSQHAAWAKAFPSCNWALACGPSRVAVIDVDGEVGEDSLFEFELEHGPLPVTLEQKTPHGRHLIFGDPDGHCTNSVGRLGPGLDTRARGGYIVIEPSTINGVRYEFS